MISALEAKTKISLLRALRSKEKSLGSSKSAFTLVELMIVVAVIGLLSAVALPQYLQARRAAEAGARIGETIGTAKECAAAVAAGGIGLPTGCNNAASTNFTSSWSGSVSNLRCLNITSTGSRITVQVSATGGLSCSIG